MIRCLKHVVVWPQNRRAKLWILAAILYLNAVVVEAKEEYGNALFITTARAIGNCAREVQIGRISDHAIDVSLRNDVPLIVTGMFGPAAITWSLSGLLSITSGVGSLRGATIAPSLDLIALAGPLPPFVIRMLNMIEPSGSTRG